MTIHFFALALICSAFVGAYSAILFKAARATNKQVAWLSCFLFCIMFIEMVAVRYIIAP